MYGATIKINNDCVDGNCILGYSIVDTTGCQS